MLLQSLFIYLHYQIDNTNILIMEISKIITDKILKDNDFSLGLAKIFDQKQQSVLLLARRKSGKLTQYKAVKYYIEKGFVESDIFEKEPVEQKRKC